MMKFFGSRNDPPAPPEPASADLEEQAPLGLFARMKQAVSRTRESLSSKIEGIAALTRTVDEAALEDLESALLSSDLGVQTTSTILEALRDRARPNLLIDAAPGPPIDRRLDGTALFQRIGWRAPDWPTMLDELLGPVAADAVSS